MPFHGFLMRSQNFSLPQLNLEGLIQQEVVEISHNF